MMKKICSIVTLLLFLPSVLYAQEYRFYVIDNFSRGQNSHINTFLISKDQAKVAQNVRMNDVYGSLSKREALISSVDYGTTAINSIHRYYKSDATTTTIVATSTLLRADFSGTATTIDDALTDGKRWQFVTYQDIAIGGNDTDLPIKYDGHTLVTANTDAARTATELCAQLGAPFAELDSADGGNDLDASSWYMYKIAWYNGTTYSHSTARSNPILTGAAVYNIALTDIPIGPSGTTHRYIYRTLGGADQATVEADTVYYLVDSIADNSTTTYADNETDAGIGGDAAPTWATASGGTNATPPICPIWTIHNESLFGGGNTTYRSQIYWSDEYNPDYFDPTDVEEIRPDDGDEVTFLKNQLGILTIGKTNTIQRFYTTASDSDDWYASDPFSHIGCPAPYSVANTPIGIFYLSRIGLRNYNGQNSQPISDAVTDVINDISQIDIEIAAGCFHDNQYLLSYASSASGSAINNRLLRYDLIRDAYVVDTMSLNCFATFGSGTDTGVLYSGSSTTDGYVVIHSAGSNLLSKRYLSEFNAGTWDDARGYNTENEPIIELAWDCTIDGWLTELQVKDADIDNINEITTELSGVPIIDRPDTDGTWTSEIYQINAAALNKLYWNENLGSGDIAFQIRLGATSGACGAAGWNTAVSDSNGSDVSGITANNFVQFRANLSTTNINSTPILEQRDGYVFKMTYSQEGSAYETSVVSLYETGWTNLGVEGYKKQISRMKVFYEGSSGTVTLTTRNEEGDIEREVDIDLSVSASLSSEDEYTGEGDDKVFTYEPPVNSETEPSMIGEWWRFAIQEEGVIGWEIKRIQVMYTVEEIY